MEQQYLTIWDLVLTPLYLVALILIAKRIRNRNYPKGHPLRSYYIQGLYVKFGGAIFIGLIYAYYYKGGDTLNYFDHAKIINSSLDHSFSTWLDLMQAKSPDENPYIYKYSSQMFWYGERSTYTVACICALLGLFNGTTYMPTALLFAFISYSGIWAMYRTFVNIYPQLVKPLAFAFLFIPGVAAWGSSIFKDTVCMFALGWLTYCTFRVFISRDSTFKNLFMLSLSFYLIAIIKVYIILAFVPALSLWLLMTFSKKIHFRSLRILINLLFIAVTATAFLFLANRFASELNEYSLDNLANKAKKTQNWITYVSEAQEGSSYSIGEFDPTPLGMLKKFPQAVVVTLYRPFLWEINKPIVALSALESFFFFALTLVILFKLGIKTVYKRLASDANLLFFLIFTLIFAFSVGISTGNFGSLSRYKIPCTPFFAALLFILYYSSETLKKSTKIHASKQTKPVHHLA